MEFVTKFLTSITPELGDPTFSILKSHLVFEEMLRTYLEKTFPRPEALTGARLTFAQLLAVAKATCPPRPSDDWIWTAMVNLNQLRNLLAHNLAPEKLSEKTSEYVEFVVTNMKVPLPTPSHRIIAHDSGESPAPIRFNEPLYLEFDIATIGLYGRAMDHLGLELSSPAMK